MEDLLKLREEAYQVASAMVKYGGSFVAALGSALQRADIKNAQKIRDTFPEYWANFLKMYQLDQRRGR